MSFLILLASLLTSMFQTSFEVASVRPVQLTPGDYRINLGTAAHGRVTLNNATLTDCLKYAYEISNDRQIAGPDWINDKSVRFDIEAKAAPDTPVARLRVMLQALLTERFKLVLHREPREIAYLALVVGKKGPRFQQAQDGLDNAGKPSGPGKVFVRRLPMLATLLSRFMRETVIDMTGLTGMYDIQLEWSPEHLDKSADSTEPASGPSIYTAVQEQLGLRLESRKGPVEVLIIDRAEKTPVEN